MTQSFGQLVCHNFIENRKSHCHGSIRELVYLFSALSSFLMLIIVLFEMSLLELLLVQGRVPGLLWPAAVAAAPAPPAIPPVPAAAPPPASSPTIVILPAPCVLKPLPPASSPATP